MGSHTRRRALRSPRPHVLVSPGIGFHEFRIRIRGV